MQSYSKYSKSIQLHRLHHVAREIFFKIEEMENATFTMKSHYTLFIINTFDYNFFFILIIQKLLINQNTVSLAKLL